MAYTDVRFELAFPYYGIYVDAGTGREVPLGNPGDIGRQKVRKPKPWFSPKHYLSVMNLRDFYADNLGLRIINVMANAIDDKALRSTFSRPDSVAMRGPVNGLAIPGTNMPL